MKPAGSSNHHVMSSLVMIRLYAPDPRDSTCVVNEGVIQWMNGPTIERTNEQTNEHMNE